jgi:uncharacterized damage-inducible protein DinB
MSNYLETLSGQCQWACRNIAHNLDFIPDDKLNWKPAPTANSTLEVVGHLLGAFAMTAQRLNKPDHTDPHPQVATPATRDEAKQQLIAAADEYCQLLQSVSAETMAKVVELPFGNFPMTFLASMPVIDAIHHHGQISYVQTLLGDTESHFDFSLVPKAD